MNPSEALALAQRLGLHALRVSRSGEPVLTFGDQCRPVVVHSVRKSLISALFGQIVERGLVSLGTTLAELDVDDTPRLTAEERSATVRDLLQARSGVYLPPAAQPPPAPAHLVPAGWVDETTGPVSRTSAEADHSHYGHLWWVRDGSGVLPSGTFSALGLGGQFLTVVPAVDLVLVGLVDSYAHGVQPLGPADRTRLYRALLT
jgi:CubicO group peptidase (beta-lactamase class C family)